MGRIFPHSTKPAPPFLTCSRNWSTPTLPRSLVCFPTSTPKPRVVGRVRAGGTQATSRPSRQARPSPSAPAKIREVSTMLASLFFVSGHKGSATRCGCALRSACRGGLQPGGLRPGPTEAAAETKSFCPCQKSQVSFLRYLTFSLVCGRIWQRGAPAGPPAVRVVGRWSPVATVQRRPRRQPRQVLLPLPKSRRKHWVFAGFLFACVAWLCGSLWFKLWLFPSGFTRSQPFPSPPAPKTHPVSPFSG